MDYNIVKKIVDEKIPCLFVSPHLDDAVLSAGGLMHYLAGKTKISLVTIFTEASGAPYTLSAAAYLRQCGCLDQQGLYDRRREEDKNVCRKLGIEAVHFGFTDALWRKEQPVGNWEMRLAKFFPELIHVYPTYRWHVASGKIASGDKKTVQNIEKQLKLLVDGRIIVFAPAGIGRHVDHVITRDICAKIFPNVVFWSDFPYNVGQQADEAFVEKMSLKIFKWEQFLEEKNELASLYKSQFKPMFPSGMPIAPEIYYHKQVALKI